MLVNTTTDGTQKAPAVAMDADGEFVVAWMGNDSDETGVFARRYAADGTPSDVNEFRVNSTVGEIQDSPSVAIDSVGNFVIAWQGDSDPSNSDNFNIFFQRYDAAGNTLGGETPVNTDNGEAQINPDIAMRPGGEFVIAWESDDDVSNSDDFNIHFQRYDAAGDALGVNTVVNSVTASGQTNASVNVAADGRFVVTWQSDHGGDNDVYVREFDSAGNPLAVETRVNSTTTGGQKAPSVGMSERGRLPGCLEW